MLSPVQCSVDKYIVSKFQAIIVHIQAEFIDSEFAAFLFVKMQLIELFTQIKDLNPNFHS